MYLSLKCIILNALFHKETQNISVHFSTFVVIADDIVQHPFPPQELMSHGALRDTQFIAYGFIIQGTGPRGQ